MSYEDALAAARQRFRLAPTEGKHTVGDARDNDLAFLRADNPPSTVSDTEARIEGLIRPEFGDVEL